MMPLWMNLLGYKFLEMHSSNVVMKVPYNKIVASLGGLIVPLLIGILIARWRPTWGAKARKVRVIFLNFIQFFV
jgi:sodium/bile acid cotransporter 3/5